MSPNPFRWQYNGSTECTSTLTLERGDTECAGPWREKFRECTSKDRPLVGMVAGNLIFRVPLMNHRERGFPPKVNFPLPLNECRLGNINVNLCHVINKLRNPGYLLREFCVIVPSHWPA